MLGHGFKLMRFDREEEGSDHGSIELSRPCSICDGQSNRHSPETLSDSNADGSFSDDEATGD